ncbi:universal stress protein [Actinomadura sp. 6N118]|uniref:universal stress protein n=1 Tax=Actinomadura sp. 6N118 TaxID=3375151 RepID=UPI0037B4F507
MKGTILVGVDGSEPSDAVLDWALREAARRGVPVRLAGDLVTGSSFPCPTAPSVTTGR